ncbi:MAG: sulfite oxidase-like oxidoreductase [Alphaproteobacteria bacterium]|nr:sulfite oxidase-like oxidoreductase [Alphaproteobacteria bacterium]
MTDESKRDKLIAAKEAWAREGRRPKGGAEAGAGRRLPPGQREVHDFPVLDLGQQPNLSRKEWRLSVSGLVERPIDWSWDDFLAQPQVTLVSDIHCVTSWSRYDNTWQGVSARHLLDVARPRPEAKFLMLKSFDGYSTNVPLARFAEEDVLLAHSWEGRALERQHGGPVRVVLPSLYFWKSAKWLRHITVMAQDAPGFWEARGYHMNGDPWDEERYGSP